VGNINKQLFLEGLKRVWFSKESGSEITQMSEEEAIEYILKEPL
jgi:hypothetical protein